MDDNNKSPNMEKDQSLICESEEQQSPLAKSDTQVYESIRAALAEARTKVVSTVNQTMVSVYWEIGRQITDAVGERAEYGLNLLSFLSERLTAEFGKGFTVANLRNMRQFYHMFPNRYALRSELTWTHYRMLMRIDETSRRDFYLKESAEAGWTSRQLERQIHSFYYERLLATQKEHRPEIASEIFKLEPNNESEYILKDPYILEFLDLKENTKYSENQLEQGLIDKLHEILLELGKGFSFVARQKRITTEGGRHYYIDLVFYNYIIKCFIVIDLKAGDLSYQDIGQIDFYTRLFDDKIKGEDDNPTIGIVLCAGKDETLVKYSVLADKENLFASKYKLFLPTEEELKAELMRERELIEREIDDIGGEIGEV
ncbi:MAG: PDDEXK nuclease domain-containing protein [Clostridiales Family XIII bacterium]|jgi:predicted nuclease of restriction endonuclease-like (RecB) superfamily|nr:PDDEXK nuclease domain-containing protein [Clostridiales Family XIII bacterium]